MQKYQSENITDLAKSLLNVQRTVQPVTKDAENPFTKSWYASLNSVMDARSGFTSLDQSTAKLRWTVSLVMPPI